MEQIALLLRQAGFGTWAERIASQAAKVRDGDWRGVSEYVDNFRGTQGSLGDQPVGERPGDPIYDQFRSLKSSSYSLASAICRDFTPSFLESLLTGWRGARFGTKVLLVSLVLVLLLFIQQVIAHATD